MYLEVERYLKCGRIDTGVEAMEYLKDQKEKEAIQWMNEAVRVAEKALCLKAKCGTVIVKDGEVIGEGYNAPPLDKEENRMCDQEPRQGKPRYDQTCCMHAEWRAIVDALKRNPEKLKDSKLYFIRVSKEGELKRSGKPYCTVCSRLALDAGISHFLLWHEEGISEYPTGEYNRLSYEYIHE
jgi:deoxycytidylate deaminase